MPTVKHTPLKKKKSTTKSDRAGLVFPVSKMNRAIKETSGMPRVGGSCPVYMASVVEYIVTEVMELAGNRTKQDKRKRITPDDLSMAVRSDFDLSKLCRDLTFCTGDKLKNTSKALDPRPSRPNASVQQQQQ